MSSQHTRPSWWRRFLAGFDRNTQVLASVQTRNLPPAAPGPVVVTDHEHKPGDPGRGTCAQCISHRNLINHYGEPADTETMPRIKPPVDGYNYHAAEILADMAEEDPVQPALAPVAAPPIDVTVASWVTHRVGLTPVASRAWVVDAAGRVDAPGVHAIDVATAALLHHREGGIDAIVAGLEMYVRAELGLAA